MGSKNSSTMTTRKRHRPEQVTLIGVSLSPGAGVRAWRRDRCHGNWAGYVEAGRQGGGVSRRLGGDELPYWPSSCVTSFVIPWMTLKLTQVEKKSDDSDHQMGTTCSENYSRIGLRFAHSPPFSTKAHEMKEPPWSNWHEL